MPALRLLQSCRVGLSTLATHGGRHCDLATQLDPRNREDGPSVSAGERADVFLAVVVEQGKLPLAHVVHGHL